MKNVAILMAAGQGLRVGGDLPKQFVRVGDKMLLEYALQTFHKHPRIDEIVVVLPAQCDEEIQPYLQTHYPKIKRLVEGGKERFQSSWNAIQVFENRREDNLLLHDAARPGLSEHIIDEILDVLEENQAVVTAMPATDTILRVDDDMAIRETLIRSELYYAQTPQAFRAGLLYDCFLKLFDSQCFLPTDESGVVAHFRPDVKIRVVKGESKNFKVTYPEDVAILNSLR